MANNMFLNLFKRALGKGVDTTKNIGNQIMSAREGYQNVPSDIPNINPVGIAEMLANMGAGGRGDAIKSLVSSAYPPAAQSAVEGAKLLLSQKPSAARNMSISSPLFSLATLLAQKSAGKVQGFDERFAEKYGDVDVGDIIKRSLQDPSVAMGYLRKGGDIISGRDGGPAQEEAPPAAEEKPPTTPTGPITRSYRQQATAANPYLGMDRETLQAIQAQLMMQQPSGAVPQMASNIANLYAGRNFSQVPAQKQSGGLADKVYAARLTQKLNQQDPYYQARLQSTKNTANKAARKAEFDEALRATAAGIAAKPQAEQELLGFLYANYGDFTKEIEEFVSNRPMNA